MRRSPRAELVKREYKDSNICGLAGWLIDDFLDVQATRPGSNVTVTSTRSSLTLKSSQLPVYGP